MLISFSVFRMKQASNLHLSSIPNVLQPIPTPPCFGCFFWKDKDNVSQGESHFFWEEKNNAIKGTLFNFYIILVLENYGQETQKKKKP